MNKKAHLDREETSFSALKNLEEGGKKHRKIVFLPWNERKKAKGKGQIRL
jgi:hypothetical protein